MEATVISKTINFDGVLYLLDRDGMWHIRIYESKYNDGLPEWRWVPINDKRVPKEVKDKK